MLFFKMIVLLLFVFIPCTFSSEWNCTLVKTSLDDDFFSPSRVSDPITEQCTITVEYENLHQSDEKYVCLSGTLAISSLPWPSMSSNHSMQTFKLNSCQLSTLGQLPFSLPSSVERLDLSSNSLSTFVLSFPLSSNLKFLRLDRNPNLIDLHFGSTRVQQDLRRLSLRHNKKMRISSLPSDLTHLDLTDCNLSQSSLSTLLISLRQLTHLSLADNQLERLPSIDQSLVTLQYLNLSNNHLTFVDQQWLTGQMTRLDLRNNQIQSVEFLRNLFNDQNRHDQTVQFSLNGNPLQCDCWLNALMNSSIVITDYHLLQCHSRSIFEIPSEEFLCPYSRHCTSDCQCCDFEACDCHSVCPDGCRCSHDLHWNRHIVQCSQANLSKIHLLLPQSITELDYHDNQIDEIPPFLFMGKTSLVKLRLTKNHLHQLSNDTFCAALNLEEISLSENPMLKIDLSDLHRLFGCLKKLKYLIVSKEQIDEHQFISDGWRIFSQNSSDQTICLTPTGGSSTVSTTTTSTIFSVVLPVTKRPLHHSETIVIALNDQQECLTCTTSTTRSIPFLQHNQTLIVIVFFLLFFVLLFLIVLILLAICRRKLRQHLTAELQRQHSHHYYYHTRLHQPISKGTESNAIIGTNDSLYEQLPSLSSDSELPFLYNDHKSSLRSASVLPPASSVSTAPPAGTFRQHFCCHPTGRFVPAPVQHCHEYQYATTTTSANTGYSTPSGQQHQCGSIFLWANRLLSPTQTASNRRPCRLHSSPSELQHLQQYLLSNPSDPNSTTADNNVMRYCNNETIFVPTTNCPCRNYVQNGETYIYPHVHR